MKHLNQHFLGAGNCPICRVNIHYKAFVIVSPWVRKRIGTSKKFSQLGICKSCFGGSFSFRYDDKQMKHLYQNYRDDNYNNLRFKWEKWYGAQYSKAHRTNYYIEGRKKELAEFLTTHFTDNIGRVVDIGGGNGELIPDNLPTYSDGIQKYVLDISNTDSIPQVTKIKSLQEIDKIDLVIYSHVIEHVADPRSELVKTLRHTNNIYLEVPYGVPKINCVNSSILLNVFFVMLSMNHFLWRNMFSLSVGLKSKMRVLTQSEHINFFEVATIEKLADLVDCDSKIKISWVDNPLRQKHQVIQALFSKR